MFDYFDLFLAILTGFGIGALSISWAIGTVSWKPVLLTIMPIAILIIKKGIAG